MEDRVRRPNICLIRNLEEDNREIERGNKIFPEIKIKNCPDMMKDIKYSCLGI